MWRPAMRASILLALGTLAAAPVYADGSPAAWSGVDIPEGQIGAAVAAVTMALLSRQWQAPGGGQGSEG